jgi:cell division septation protein DedD/nucleoid DNA-binding protein
MRLDPFIIDLLYEHDCVIIPEFGGLVANYKSAKLNGITHVIQPPAKAIGFNPSLKYNDGLLTNYVSSVLAISYKEAAELVASTVDDFRSQLLENGRFSIDRVGVFYRDRFGQTQFIPEEQENFLLSSYGLQPIQLRLLNGGEVPDTAKVIPLHTHAARRWKMAAAVLLPALLAGSWFLARTAGRHDELGFGIHNPFSEPRKQTAFIPSNTGWDLSMQFPSNRYEEMVPAQLATASLATTNESPSESETSETFNVSANSRASAIVKPESKKWSATKTSAAAPSVVDLEKAYSVIGGAFQIKENGQRLIEQLRAQGYDAQFAGMRDNLHLVAYGHFNNREEAEAVKVKVQATGAKAWIRTNQ